MKFLLKSLCLVAFVLWVSPSYAQPTLSFGITDSTIGDGTASGTIFDSTNQIGTWSVSGFSFTVLPSALTYTPTIGTVATNTPENPYGKPGIGILISAPGGARENGVTRIQYTVGWTLNPGYTLDSASFWGKYPNTVGFYGPAQPTGNGGNISLSGFSGQGVVSDPSNKLQVADGYQFTSGENLGGWTVGPTQGTAQAGVDWQLTAPSASSYTFTLDYTEQSLSAANESTAFTLNVVPEPSTYALLALSAVGFAGYVIRRRRR